MSQCSVSLICVACAAAITRHGDGYEHPSEECTEEANSQRWILLPERREPRRHEQWLCRECADDVVRLAQ